MIAGTRDSIGATCPAPSINTSSLGSLNRFHSGRARDAHGCCGRETYNDGAERDCTICPDIAAAILQAMAEERERALEEAAP